jgi:hypothetical protein
MRLSKGAAAEQWEQMMFALFIFTLAAWGSAWPANASPDVRLVRVPEGGIQPEVAVDSSGGVHLIFFKGNPGAGDLFYAYSRNGIDFSSPIRVNSIPDTAIATGNIRGGRIALGRNGNVFIVWNGSHVAAESNGGRTPMLFARLNEQRTSFEPERNLIRSAYGIDGGGAVAADRGGHVYVFWHAPLPGRKGEEYRRVWMARSDDDGKTFQPERVIFERPTGACGCCSLAAAADLAGRIFVLFRAAHEVFQRDMYLLESTNYGDSFRGTDIAKWHVGYCVMSSAAFAMGRLAEFASWESENQVQFGRIEPNLGDVSEFRTAGPGADQKYPALAENRGGELLVAWTEGMGWNRGGTAHWRIVNLKGETIGRRGAAPGVPTWSLVAAYSLPDGDFVVMY